jgi:response regulator RpfG family c-di-GMP phosphodiesterase
VEHHVAETGANAVDTASDRTVSSVPVNILLVDDTPAKLLTYEVILAELGEKLIKASSVEEALGILLKVDVALILTDVSMPTVDGFDFAKVVREHPRFKTIPIIFVSAIAHSDVDRLRGYASGAVDYVTVPVAPELLRGKVKVFVDLYRKHRELEMLKAELEARVARRTAQLAASEERYRSLFESSSDGIFVNKGGRIILANPVLLQMLGCDSASMPPRWPTSRRRCWPNRSASAGGAS